MSEPTSDRPSGQPTQPYQLPPYQTPPEPPRQSGLPGWVIGLIIGGAVLIVVCIVGAIGTIGVLTLLGTRVSQVFSNIETGLGELPTAAPVDTSAAEPIGATASVGDLEISVTDAHPLTDLDATDQPDEGYEYWAVNVTFVSNAQRPVTLSVFSTLVQDGDDNVYQYSILGQQLAPKPPFPTVQTLRPSSKLSGFIVYEVPKDAGELFWVYADPTGGGAASFAIKGGR